MFSFHKLISAVFLLICFAASGTTAVNASDATSNVTGDRSKASAAATGYSALKLFLEDEQYLTAIRRTKMVITFSGISDDSSKLIDDITNSSEQALEELEKLVEEKPRITLKEFSDDMIAKSTLDSMRLTTAKEFLFDTDDFEKNLLVSQLKALRVISHLALQLEQIETNNKRKTWLNKLAARYENHYQDINARISITEK